jgi:hypothetical protein
MLRESSFPWTEPSPSEPDCLKTNRSRSSISWVKYWRVALTLFRVNWLTVHSISHRAKPGLCVD